MTDPGAIRSEAEDEMERAGALERELDHLKAAEAYRNASRLYRELGERPFDWAAPEFHYAKQLSLARRFEQSVVAFDVAAESFQPLGPRRVADCRAGAGAALARLGRYEEATNRLSEALVVYTESQRNHLCSTKIDLAYVYLQIGRYEDAVDELASARPLCITTLQAVGVELIEADIETARSRYANAEACIDRAWRLSGDTDPMISARLHASRALVKSNAGDIDRARELYQRAIESYSQINTLAVREQLAVCTMNLGAVLGAEGRHSDALDRYRDALEIFEQTPPVLDRIADCRMNIGVEYLMLGDVVNARAALEDARDQYDALPGLVRQSSGCAMNLAKLHTFGGDFDAARSEYDLARAGFGTLGLPEWSARCTVNSVLGRAAVSEGKSAALLAELLPAMVYLDSIRFQFPTAASRTAWRTTVEDATRTAFALARDDPATLTELIEWAINSGVHNAGSSPAKPLSVVEDASAAGLQDKLFSFGASSHADASGKGASAYTSTGSGTTRLIAGAALPMSRPPALLMPGGGTALGKFYDAAIQEYPDTTEPRIEIAVYD